jgi:hypothetical protein
MNHKSSIAYFAEILYFLLRSNLPTKTLACLLNLASTAGGKINCPFTILEIVSEWYSDSKGVAPDISL